MIAYLKGTIHHAGTDRLIILAGGVGYNVFIKPTFDIPLEEDAEIELYIYTNMKENALELFGFNSPQELSLFETLISVSGIGPKTGLSVLSVGTPQQILSALENKDASFFQSVSGIGKRTANRVILELQDKITDQDLITMTGSAKQEALEALIELGYRRSEAEAALSKIEAESIEDQIKEALKVI